jgi:hypothetical protein
LRVTSMPPNPARFHTAMRANDWENSCIIKSPGQVAASGPDCHSRPARLTQPKFLSGPLHWRGSGPIPQI